jgi:hypothetical protein
VKSSGRNPTSRFLARASIAVLSRASYQVVAERSGHYVQYDRPQIVVEAIRAIVEQVRL